ncbi:MAG: substrate-binding domain-containing protein [Clostridiaceae bacterium]|nr:substrate-binding domain-containing protein [Clostridiaceae bacterium]
MTQNNNSNFNKMPSSKEVAALAKVSQATVSRVFSGHTNITEKTRRRVLEAAEKLGYRPNAMARSLTLNRSNLIALVTLDVVNPHYNAMINKVADRIQKIGRELLYFVSREEKNLDEVISQVLQYRVDGIIVHSAAISSHMAAECEKNQIPVVVFNKYTVNKNVMTVCSDNVRAGWMAANHFYDRGYRNFAFIGSHTFSATSKDRLRGFKDALYEKGIENCVTQMVPYTYEAGATAARTILNEQKKIDAIFCAGDLLALGAIDVIKYEYGLQIPQDIAIIGFDNIEAASWPPYLLATFEQQIDKMLDTTFNYLSKKLNGEVVDEGVELFECTLIERNSAQL